MSLKKIVASKRLCKDLWERGIQPKGQNPALWYVPYNLNYAIRINGSFCLKDFHFDLWPAWTKAELDVMIGPGIDKPDLVNEIELHTREEDKAGKVFITYYPERLFFKNGADASALVLSHALEQGKLTADEAMARYNLHFAND